MENSIEYKQLVANLQKPGEDIQESLTPGKCHLWHMASCIPEEAGEVFGVIKKYLIYNKDLDLDKLVKELGDLEFYLEGLRSELGITREQVLACNIEKLSKRYESGKYSDSEARDRKEAAG